MSFSVFLLLLAILCMDARSSTDTCENIDGDCPDSCGEAGYEGNLNFNAKLYISPTHTDIERVAAQAEKVIVDEGLKVHARVNRLDNPATGLHTTIYYFCCYTQEEKEAIKDALHNMAWKSFEVEYDSFACNLDHNNETVYLHALPSDQSDLFALADTIETTVREAGVAIPSRETLFHMTLARVGYDYPADETVTYFLDNAADWNFGSVILDRFCIEDDVYVASQSTKVNANSDNGKIVDQWSILES